MCLYSLRFNSKQRRLIARKRKARLGVSFYRTAPRQLLDCCLSLSPCAAPFHSEPSPHELHPHPREARTAPLAPSKARGLRSAPLPPLTRLPPRGRLQPMAEPLARRARALQWAARLLACGPGKPHPVGRGPRGGGGARRWGQRRRRRARRRGCPLRPRLSPFVAPVPAVFSHPPSGERCWGGPEGARRRKARGVRALRRSAAVNGPRRAGARPAAAAAVEARGAARGRRRKSGRRR